MGIELDDLRVPRPDVELARRLGRVSRISAFPPGSSAAPITPPFISSSRARGRTSPPPWRSITGRLRHLQRRDARAGPETRPGHGADCPSPSRRVSHADAGRRACSRPRWPSGSMRPWDSAISAGFSSTYPSARSTVPAAKASSSACSASGLRSAGLSPPTAATVAHRSTRRGSPRRRRGAPRTGATILGRESIFGVVGHELDELLATQLFDRRVHRCRSRDTSPARRAPSSALDGEALVDWSR